MPTSVPRVQVEWIDELVFPEGWEVALKLHLSGAPEGAAACNPAQLSEELKPSPDAGPGNLVVQRGAWRARRELNPRPTA